MKKKDNEYNITMDTLQNDIDDLEAEKADLKQRLQALAKRNVLEDLGMRPTGFAGPSPGKSAEIAAMLKKPSSPGVSEVEVTDSPMLTQQIASLRTALRLKTQECSKLTSDHIIKEIKALAPIKLPSANNQSVENDDPKLKKMKAEFKKVKTSFDKLLIPQVIDISKRKPGHLPVGSASPMEQVKQQRREKMLISSRLEDISNRIQHHLADQSGSVFKGNFATFPSDKMKEHTSESCQLIGTLRLPNLKLEDKVESSDLYMNMQQINQLHGKLFGSMLECY